MRKIFKDAEKLGLDNIDNFDTLVSKRTKNFMLQLMHDNEHFIHDFEIPLRTILAHKI